MLCFIRLAVTDTGVVSSLAKHASAAHAFFKEVGGTNEGLFVAESSHKGAAGGGFRHLKPSTVVAAAVLSALLYYCVPSHRNEARGRQGESTQLDGKQLLVGCRAYERMRRIGTQSEGGNVARRVALKGAMVAFVLGHNAAVLVAYIDCVAAVLVLYKAYPILRVILPPSPRRNDVSARQEPQALVDADGLIEKTNGGCW